MEEKIAVFIVAASEDEAFLTELETHLQPLILENHITTWHEHKLLAGAKRESEIEEHWTASSIIILLISANFLASKAAVHMGMRAVERNRQQHQIRVIPILLQEVDWEESIFGKFAPLPADGKPILSWENRHTAYRMVAQGIRELVRQLKERSDSFAYPPVDEKPLIAQNTENHFSGSNEKIFAPDTDRLQAKAVAPPPDDSSANVRIEQWEIGELPFQTKSALVNKLLSCPTIKDRSSRDIVVQHLNAQIATSILRHAVDRVDVTNIVSTCQNFSNGLPELVEVIGFFEGDSIPMRQLRIFVETVKQRVKADTILP